MSMNMRHKPIHWHYRAWAELLYFAHDVLSHQCDSTYTCNCTMWIVCARWERRAQRTRRTNERNNRAQKCSRESRLTFSYHVNRVANHCENWFTPNVHIELFLRKWNVDGSALFTVLFLTRINRARFHRPLRFPTRTWNARTGFAVVGCARLYSRDTRCRLTKWSQTDKRQSSN